jgi:DNA-binding transcriptional LysR family regulator
MDLRQLQAFLAVVEHGGFTAAARATHTVQSNISTHVARLERELDATLIDRATGHMTQEGEAVLSRVRRIQSELESLQTDVSSLRGSPRGSVRIGIIGTTARWLTPLLVDRLAGETPDIRLVVAEGTTTSLLLRLLDGSLDIAIVGMPVSDPEVRCSALFTEERVVIAPTDHPLARSAGPLTMQELARHPLLLAAAGTTFRHDVNEAFARHGLVPVAKLEVDGLRLMASLAFQGYGAAIVPATAAPGWLGGDWVQLSVPELGRRGVGIAERRRGMPSVAAQATKHVIHEVIASEVGAIAGVEASNAL